MGDYHQDIVFKEVNELDLELTANKILNYLKNEGIIQDIKRATNPKNTFTALPGKKWDLATQYKDPNFLTLSMNEVEIIIERQIFWADGAEFESINCPKCGANNKDCDWGELFSIWIKEPESAILKCHQCQTNNMISEHQFDPVWALSNLGIKFWNWPLLSSKFISNLETLIDKKTILVTGKL